MSNVNVLELKKNPSVCVHEYQLHWVKSKKNYFLKTSQSLANAPFLEKLL